MGKSLDIVSCICINFSQNSTKTIRLFTLDFYEAIVDEADYEAIVDEAVIEILSS